MAAVNAGHVDDNQNPSITGVIGTLGTADTGGTAKTLPVGVNPLNGAMYVQDLSGVSGTTNVQVLGGTVDVVSSVANLAKGTITRIEGGTINRILTVGTLEVGTISTLPNIPGGTIGVVSSITNIVGGTITALANGTINTGTVVNNGGTAGTVTGVGVVTSVTNVAGGTVKLNPNPSIWDNTYGTTSAGTIGTIVAAPSAGSAIIIDALSVNQISGTAEVLVSFGLAANGNGVVTRGLYPAGGGESKNYGFPVGGSTTGSALTWNILSGSGTVSYSVAYRILVP